MPSSAGDNDAVSCDILPSESSFGPHVRGDALELAKWEVWDLMVAFPPCTYLSNAGARWWKKREREQRYALDFVRDLMAAPIPKIAIENPMGKISTAIRRPDQVVQPWWFGDPWIKTTGLWLDGLPGLVATNLVEPVGHWVGGSTELRHPELQYGERAEFRAPGVTKKQQRSYTFQGVADAMASQWG